MIVLHNFFEGNSFVSKIYWILFDPNITNSCSASSDFTYQLTTSLHGMTTFCRNQTMPPLSLVFQCPPNTISYQTSKDSSLIFTSSNMNITFHQVLFNLQQVATGSVGDNGEAIWRKFLVGLMVAMPAYLIHLLHLVAFPIKLKNHAVRWEVHHIPMSIQCQGNKNNHTSLLSIVLLTVRKGHESVNVATETDLLSTHLWSSPFFNQTWIWALSLVMQHSRRPLQTFVKVIDW